ncbi:MAG: translesion DNA synthesis-associated protein ImuA [Pseudomonadales bacterium]
MASTIPQLHGPQLHGPQPSGPQSPGLQTSGNQEALAMLLQHPSIWQANEQHLRDNSNAAEAVSSSYPELDSKLHMGGWPCSGSTELFSDQFGIGELSLLIPALNALSQRNTQRCTALVAPPHAPNAPALLRHGIDVQRVLVVQAYSLADKLWISEQLLRSGHFSAVISWLDEHKLSYAQLRKIQLAAHEGQSWGVSFRPSVLSEQSSPAKLRIRLQAKKKHLQLDILKQQGGWAGQKVLLPRPAALLANTLQVNNWISTDLVSTNSLLTSDGSINNALASDTLTLTAPRNIHSRHKRSKPLRGYSTTTRQLRQRPRSEIRHSD